MKASGAKGNGQGASATLRLSVATALAVGALMPLRAQGIPGAPAHASPAQIAARQQVAAFEGVLENAVRYGAQKLIQHASVTPAATTRFEVLLTGQARARGFRLDGYGAVFDVEFPSIRRSVAWTMSTLERPDPELLAGLKELRKRNQNEVDLQSRQEMDRLIKEMEDQIQAYNSQAKTVPSATPTQSVQAPVAVDDPRTFYAAELTNALIAAVLDQGSAIGIGPNEWLTVAARESLDFRFVPDDPATTLIMRVKGSDLTALRDKRLTQEDARQRIEVKQY